MGAATSPLTNRCVSTSTMPNAGHSGSISRFSSGRSPPCSPGAARTEHGKTHRPVGCDPASFTRIPGGMNTTRDNQTTGREPRVAIVHDYLNQHGGAERVLEELHAIWPEAPIFVSIYDRERMPAAYRDWPIRPTFMQRLPGILRNHQPYLPVYPLAFARLDLRGY